MSNSLVERFKNLLTHNLNQLICVASRNVAGAGRLQDARDYLAIATPDFDFVSGIDGMSGLDRPAVKQNKTRVAKLLSNGAARAKATYLQKKIKTHLKRMRDEG